MQRPATVLLPRVACLLLAALTLLAHLLSQRLATAPQPDPTTRLTAHLRARQLLLHRDGRRLVFLAPHPATRARLCALAAAAGELLSSAHCPQHGGGAGSAWADEPDPAAACRSLRGAPHTALLLSALADTPHWDARAVYVAVLSVPGTRSWAEAPSLRALAGVARRQPRGRLERQHLAAAEVRRASRQESLCADSASGW